MRREVGNTPLIAIKTLELPLRRGPAANISHRPHPISYGLRGVVVELVHFDVQAVAQVAAMSLSGREQCTCLLGGLCFNTS